MLNQVCDGLGGDVGKDGDTVGAHTNVAELLNEGTYDVHCDYPREREPKSRHQLQADMQRR